MYDDLVRAIHCTGVVGDADEVAMSEPWFTRRLEKASVVAPRLLTSMRSGDIFDHHFPNIVALSVQHFPGTVDCHPDHGFGGKEGRGWHHQLHGFDFDLQQGWTGLGEPALNGPLEFAYFGRHCVPKGPSSSLSER